MNDSQKKMIEHLESLSLIEARKLIASHHYGRPGSINQSLCESWLSSQEATSKDLGEQESLSIAQRALSESQKSNKIAMAAIVISFLTAIIVLLAGE